MLTLVGLPDSPYVRRVAITLRLCGLPFQHRVLSVFRQQDEMREINPTLKVPALILQDGTRLLDSSLILDWIAQQLPADRPLLPSGGARNRALEALGLALVVYEKAVQILYEMTLRPPERQHAPWLERCTMQLQTALRELESHAELDFSGMQANAQQALSQSQIAAAVGVRFMQHIRPRLPFELFDATEYPRLAALSTWCESLPAFIDTPLMPETRR